MKITKDIKYIGVADCQIDLFEGIYHVPDGVLYNSYVILDEKIAVLDAVDGNFASDWLVNLATELDGRLPDYLVVHHMEPDHSAAIADFLKIYPQTAVVGNARTFYMLKNYFGDIAFQAVEVKDGDCLNLGKHSLKFVFAPMVHWPEVMASYDACDQVLFSADAFGKFGSTESCENWADEARRYYIGIVGKYGVQVQSLLKKIAAQDISHICPLHGPVLSQNLGYYVGLYDTWSRYAAESDGVLVAYTSVYGHTRKAAELFAEQLKQNGCNNVVTTDLARSDMPRAVADAFRFGKIVLATTTYNLQIFPAMREFLCELTLRNFQNRKVALVENGSWAPTAGKLISDMLADCKNVEIVGKVTIVSAMTEQNRLQIADLAKTLAEA